MLFIKRSIIAGEPLLIEPEVISAYLDESLNLLEKIGGSQAFGNSELLRIVFGERPKARKEGNVGIIPIDGVIGKNLDDMDKLMGSCDVNDISRDLDTFVADKSVTKILFDINSGGGTVNGIPELADAIFYCPKDTTAFTDSKACSAAYWLGSQCRSFVATPSATTASVGVFMAVPDVTKHLEQKGIKMEVFASGKYKGAGAIGTSLTDDHREMFNSDVREIKDRFADTVLRVRKQANASLFEGQSINAKKAAANGLITGIVNSRRDVLSRLQSAN